MEQPLELFHLEYNDDILYVALRMLKAWLVVAPS